MKQQCSALGCKEKTSWVKEEKYFYDGRNEKGKHFESVLFTIKNPLCPLHSSQLDCVSTGSDWSITQNS